MASPPTWPIFAKKAESAPRSEKNQFLGPSLENQPIKLIWTSLCTVEKTMNCSLPCHADGVFPLALQGFRLRRLDILFAAGKSLSRRRAAKLTNCSRRDGSTSRSWKATLGPGIPKSNLSTRMSLSSVHEDDYIRCM